MTNTTQASGFVVLLPTGYAMPDRETDDGGPWVFTHRAAAAAAAAELANTAAQFLGFPDLSARVIPAADYTPPPKPIPLPARPAWVAVTKLAGTDAYRTPPERITHAYAILLADGTLYANSDDLALGRSHTTYRDPDTADTVATTLRKQAIEHGLIGATFTVVSRAIHTTVTDWHLAY